MNSKNKQALKKLVFAAMFFAIGIVLPMLTGQIKEIGDSLLPMHLVVLLCGFICGTGYGAVVGVALPFVRSLIFSMPPMYPNAVWMAAELLTYGAIAGFLYGLFKKKNLVAIYVSLIVAQIAGRISWAIVKSILLGMAGKAFTLTAFLIGGFVDALLGIVLQLILIPIILSIINRQNKSI